MIVVALVVAGCSTSDDGDLEAFCAAASDTERFQTVFDDLDPTDVDAAIAAFEEARATENELRSSAPEAVRADVDVLIRFFDDLIDGLEAADPDSTGRPAVYDELRPRFDQVEAASDRIELYVSTNC